ncbi:MAG: hypothetical protein ABI972_31085 [Acidobacteriota bacterium]
MTTPDLFESFTRAGSSIVPPTRPELAEAARDRGIKRAEQHAAAANPEWKERALGYLRLYALVHREFLCEAVRAEAEKDGLDTPGDARAWASVIRTGKAQGIIEFAGFAQATDPKVHRSWNTLWASKIYEGGQ